MCFGIVNYAFLTVTVSVEDNVFHTGTIELHMSGSNADGTVIGEKEFIFEPGMRVVKSFYVENTGTAEAYYKVYFDNVGGELAKVLEVTIKEGNAVLTEGILASLTKEQVLSETEMLGVQERKDLTITFYYPKEAGNSTALKNVTFVYVRRRYKLRIIRTKCLTKARRRLIRVNQFNRKHIAASLLTIATCLVVLCSVALAFFSSEVKNSGNHLQIAQYELGVSLSESVSTADISWDEVNNYYVINNTGNYTFILRAKGNSTGYCKVTIIRPMTDEGETPTEQTYYTAQIKPPIAADNQDAPISLILNGVVAGSRITLTPIWGKYTSNDTVNIAEGSNTITIGEPLVVQQLSLRESEETELEESEETVARIEFEEDEEATAGTELEEDADEEPIGESPAN